MSPLAQTTFAPLRWHVVHGRPSRDLRPIIAHARRIRDDLAEALRSQRKVILHTDDGAVRGKVVAFDAERVAVRIGRETILEFERVDVEAIVFVRGRS